MHLLEGMVNRALRLDPDAARRFGEMQGKTILLELAGEGAPLRLYVRPTAERLHLDASSDALPDVTISGTASVFLNQLRRGPTVSDELIIRGDIELGQRFQRVVSHFSPDWEEGLAQFVGDVPAHQLGRLARGFFSWTKETLRTLSMDGAEYLQEEAFVLAKRERVSVFLRDVDQLRADVDRLEKRIERLKGAR